VAEFPQECRRALAEDPGVFARWGDWLGEEAAERWLALLAQGDGDRALWLRAWMDAFVRAGREVASQANWADRTYPAGLPRSLRAAWGAQWASQGVPEFSEVFWRDLVELLLGIRARVVRKSSVLFPVLLQGMHGARGAGILVRWELELLEGRGGGLFPDPGVVLVRAMRPEFVEALEEAGQAAGLEGEVRARVVPANPRDESYLATGWLSGPSGGGALYVGLQALTKGLQPDAGLAVSFAVRGGRPEAVGELDVKAQACGRHGCGRLVVAEEFQLPVGVDVELVRVGSLRRAEEVVLGLARSLMGYVDRVRDALDRTPWPDPSGQLIPVTRIAVPPVVLKRVVRPAGAPRELEEGVEEEQGQGRDRRVVRPARAPRGLEEGEEEERSQVRDRRRRYRDPEVARYYEEPAEAEDWEEVLWEQEMASVRRAVILGAPGGGKTFLSRWTVLRLAEVAGAGLAEGRPLAELEVPVHVELPALVRRLDPSGPPEAALRDHLVDSGLDRQYAGRLVDLVRDSMGAWVVLDALDQVPEDSWAALRDWLRGLEGWRCRVVLTCRTPRYDRQAIPWGQLEEYQLAPLAPERVRQLFERWFGEDGAEALWGWVSENPSLLEACGSPLVASIVCWTSQDGRMPSGARRGELYDRALQRLVQRGWERLGKAGTPVELGHRLAVLREAAWKLFERHPESNDFGQSEVEEAVGAAVEELRYSLRTDQLLREFLEAGILQEAGWERGEARLAFLHRSFVEYLAGCALGRKAEREWSRWEALLDRKAWHPAWWETLVFAGWAMQDPEPLLELLADRERDDYFRHRLVLALRVLAERM
jgi:hypothetical protein